MLASESKRLLSAVLTERREAPDLSRVTSGDLDVVERIDFENGKIHTRRGATGKTSMILAYPGDLLISGINAAKGAVAICDVVTDRPIAATTHYSAYVVDQSQAYPRYLWWYLRSPQFASILRSKLPNGIKTELRSGRLLPLSVPLPDLPVQCRMATILDTAMDHVSRAKLLRVEVSGILNQLYRTTITKTFERLREAGHPLMTLAQVHPPERPISYGVLQRGSDVTDGVPLVRIGDFGRRYVRESGLVRVSNEIEGRYARTRLRGGELLIGVRGSVGRVAIAQAELAGANVSREVAVLECCDLVTSEYVRYAIIDSTSQQFLSREVRGVGQVGVSLRQLRRLAIPVPPRDSQEQVVAQLDAWEADVAELQEAQRRTQAELNALMPAIMDKAFCGEL
jgi:type I restriction enzyme S subunit